MVSKDCGEHKVGKLSGHYPPLSVDEKFIMEEAGGGWRRRNIVIMSLVRYPNCKVQYETNLN